MIIRKGDDWGEISAVSQDAIWVATDAEAAQIISAARRADEPIPPLCLTGGDIARTLGGRGDVDSLKRSGGSHAMVDLGSVLIDGRLHWFLAHLVARHSWLRGRTVVAANAAFIGEWNIAPRAHPGDGRLDFLDADLSLGDRLKARRRLPSGSHLPHPDISVQRRGSAQFSFSKPTPIYLDGQRCGNAEALSVRLENDAVEVWV